MRRVEFYCALLVVLAAVLVTGGALAIRFELSQEASVKLIQTIDENARRREVADRLANEAALRAIADQVRIGLDKTDAVAQVANNLGTQNTELLKSIQTVTQAHSQSINEVKSSAARAEQAANRSAAASKKAVKVITSPPKKKNIFGF